MVSGWGGLVYALMLAQGWGSTNAGEKITVGLFVTFCVFGIYGFHLFYAELGKSVVRTFRAKKSGE